MLCNSLLQMLFEKLIIVTAYSRSQVVVVDHIMEKGNVEGTPLVVFDSQKHGLF